MENNFHLLQERELPEQNAIGYLYEHICGAKLMHIKNKDDNRVFSITFKTPADSDAGAFHIMEHCVLCGSEKYRIKDPFNELSKGTLHTYLNAMTFDDKTMYPVAGINEKDFFKMFDVYTDAVFFPLIHKGKEVFMKEGWHMEIDGSGQGIGYGGIVYSEMTGAYSSPEEILRLRLRKLVFQHACYRFESAGNPECIPLLSYENFLEYHKKYYHPSNAFIYLYGDLDIERYLCHLDKEYLSRFDKSSVEVDIPVEPLRSEAIRTFGHSAAVKEGRRYIGMQILLRETTNPRLLIAMEALSRYLFKIEASPLKKAFAAQDVGEEIIDRIYTHMTRPLFELTVKNAAVSPSEFELIFRDTLSDIIKNGLDSQLMHGCLNRLEFSFREEDYGYRPKGLHYNIIMTPGWLYGGEPFDAMDRMKVLREIRQESKNGFFEDLITRHLLDNEHFAIYEMKGRVEVKSPKHELTEDDRKLIETEKEALRQYHDTDDRFGESTEIPLLNISDVTKEAGDIPLLVRDSASSVILHTPLETNEVAYVKFIFDTSGVPNELLPVLGLLSCLLGKLDTKNYDYTVLSWQKNQYLGGIGFDFHAYPSANSGDFKPKFTVTAKALRSNMPKLFLLTEEIISSTMFEDAKRIKTLLAEKKSKRDSAMISNGHLVAMDRAYSCISESARYSEHVGGMEFYKAIIGLLDKYDEKFESLRADLYRVSKLIFNRNVAMLHATMNDKIYTEMIPMARDFFDGLPVGITTGNRVALFSDVKNEAFITSSGVWHNAAAFRYSDMGEEYHGCMPVLGSVLNGGYLMREIRDKGGAYGFKCVFKRNGTGCFSSYRDLHLANTYEVYARAGKHISSMVGITEKEIRQAVLGTINGMDRPLPVSKRGSIALSRYLVGINAEDVKEEREQILSAGKSDIQRLAGMLEYVGANHSKCTFGGEEKIKKYSGLFERINEV